RCSSPSQRTRAETDKWRCAAKRRRGCMRRDLILRIGVKLIIPFMLLFALYVQLHGDYGPGGGFQAGVITAGAIIVYALIFGIEEAQRVVPRRLVEMLVPLGVLIYAGT